MLNFILKLVIAWKLTLSKNTINKDCEMFERHRKRSFGEEIFGKQLNPDYNMIQAYGRKMFINDRCFSKL